MKKTNERCPLHTECDRTCKYEGHEKDCDYYLWNARPGYELEDQSVMPAMSDEPIEIVADDGAADARGLVYIPIDQLYQHPDNPRKDLGDLTELAESIRINGVLQNLTVVKGHTATKEEFAKMAKADGVNKSDARAMYDKEAAFVSTGYTVVIGHRRLAAAKLAGLTELPCTISDMDAKRQISTMLLENMQRSDLTVYEQAQGFQMMLDFGESVDSISDLTGFSVSTVRRRVKLLELDEKKFKKATTRGATLMDFVELEKIEDLTLRNKVLGTIGTHNFRYELDAAIQKEKSQKNKDWLLEQLDAFAVKIDKAIDLRRVCWYSVGHDYSDDFKQPENAGEVKYFYLVETYGITLYSEKTEATPEEVACNEEYDRRQKERELRLSAFKEIEARAYKLRHDFVCGISNTKAKKRLSAIYEYAVCAILDDGYCSVDYVGMAEALSVELDDNAEWDVSDLADQLSKEPERVLMLAAYFYLEESGSYRNWNFEYEQNEELDRLYNFLEALGYEISDAELALKNGTHELYAANRPEVPDETGQV